MSGRTIMINIRVTASERDRLAELAKASRESMSTTVRRLIDEAWGAEKRGRTIDAQAVANIARQSAAAEIRKFAEEAVANEPDAEVPF